MLSLALEAPVTDSVVSVHPVRFRVGRTEECSHSLAGVRFQLPAIAGNRVFGDKHQIIDLRLTVDLLPLATNTVGDQILFRPPFPQMAHQQLLEPPTSAKMPGPRSAGRFCRGGWKRGEFSSNEEVRRGKWSTVLWVFAQERERPVVNASFQLAQGGPEFVETKQASFEHLPHGVSPLNAPAGQLLLKLFSALADETQADERICLLECSEVILLDHFRVPLLATKRRNAVRKLLVVMSATISMCTARVTMQVKRQM
ncbi:conserved hypothetical protein [Trichinella spiralis]|uniref:hypothetical protein n=1 Tax=Trichinella spiralis TaxID=6334 RepID=UPI0001EFE759|nr:conserved hypothetical protein [Trichinella spiralis]